VTLLPNFQPPRFIGGVVLLCAFNVLPARSQEAASPAAKQTPKSLEASERQPELPAQIELLETRVRFEANGDSRKEVHTRVHINNELGARQFARLAFDYNRSFQQIEFPLMRVTHSGGGTADILPSAISDQPNPAVINAPAYQDVRVKSLRILGLAPSDTLEYRVVTTTSHHPLAPDFWLDHTFDRSGVVAEELFEIDVPAAQQTQLRINPATPAAPAETADAGRIAYRWHRKAGQQNKPPEESSQSQPDVVLTSFANWQQLSDRLKNHLKPSGEFSTELFARARELARVPSSNVGPRARIQAEAFYGFVSQKIRTVDLPLGATGFKTRNPSDVLASGYGTPEDKYILFAALADNFFGPARAGLISAAPFDEKSVPSPAAFNHLLTMSGYPSINFWLDLNTEVAPFEVIPSEFRGRKALLVGPALNQLWRNVDNVLPFRSMQMVSIDASLSTDGSLHAKVRYAMRGDNELLLRVAFHQAPREKWNEVAQLLALSDGFRGKITDVSASDPYATKDPFTVEYEITQPKFVDWSKKPVRIPALLPQLGLPDPPGKAGSGASTRAIDLGTPLDVETQLTLHLPAGTVARTPTGTSVERDYATFASKYEVAGGAATASRHLNFLLREISADRVADYTTFVHAVQGDEAQKFTLERTEPAAAPKSASASDTKN
jgi:Domain of Unknown Function with PDB structure (DUF3857)